MEHRPSPSGSSPPSWTRRCAPASHAERVAGELFDVASLLRSEPALRRFADRRVAAGRGQAGLRPAGLRGQGRRRDAGAGHQRGGDAAGPSTRDLPDALERLSEITVGHVGRQGRRPAGRRAVRCSARRSAANPDLRDALADPARSTRGQGGAARLAARRQGAPGDGGARQAGARRHLPDASPARSRRTAQVAAQAQRRGRRHGARRRSRSATPSGTDWPRRSSQQYGRQVHLNEIVDPDVLGGMRVEIGDDVIDGTVSSRLDDARRKLVG